MNKKILYILIIALLFVTGCSIKIPKLSDSFYSKKLPIKEKKERLLVKRFIEYWHYRQHKDFQKSWKYELPYQRYLTPYSKYKILISGIPSSKTELIKITYKTPQIAIIVRKVFIGDKETYYKKDKWIYIKNNWYHKFYQTIFPPETEEEAEFQ